MICPHRSEYIGKPKQRYSTHMTQQECSQTRMRITPAGSNFLQGIGMYGMVTIYVATAGRAQANS